ncbi:hypothetical protein [cf. Phormidesmis sp. LEGE 11477]|uniref:hypothetical protein n=1 Tax=cf. Phormidesmis sp. LEGE 11477 TaxID=1828680 RepID=UPI001881ACE5|nr:hypothetical protein [cf. Phormidesmis sp. LEGE 11477]MBE9063927.1 hypothetical protein [cf. Phormidesmis sp. LEGE 11477]
MSDYKEFDSWRIYHLYRYLFARLAVSRKATGEPIALKIATRLGNRGFRKLVKPLFEQKGQWDGAIEQSNITTGMIVQMLSELNQNLNREYEQGEIPYNRVLTAEDTLIALHKVINLTPEECQQLGLPKGDGLTLLRQMLLTLRAAGGVENYEVVFKAYKEAVGLDFSSQRDDIENLNDIDQLITSTVADSLAYLPDKPTYERNGKPISLGKQDTILELTEKAKRAIRRLLTRSGNTRAFLSDKETENPYIRHYLQPAFVHKLAQTVVSNERLTQQFPIYLKRVTMKAYGPLPFLNVSIKDRKSSGYTPLLNPELLDLDAELNRRAGPNEAGTSGPSDYDLASQESVKFTVEFYIKVPSSYQGSIKKTFEKISDNPTLSQGDRRRVDFYLDSTGIGGTLAHIIKILNLTLLRDIPCLSSFFPIAHDVTSTQQIIRDNVSSPVWAHSLAQLCYNEAVAKALQQFDQSDRPYELSSFNDPIGHGDYCGFDFLLAQARAALMARLQAVRNTGICPDIYLSELCERTEKMIVLKKAWAALKRYPFSSMAMSGILHKNIIDKTLGADSLDMEVGSLDKQDSSIHVEAYLSIAEALLDEGAYRASYPYLSGLKFIDEYVQQGLDINSDERRNSEQEFEIFSGALIVRYLICLANYYYLYDREDDRHGEYLLPGCERDINRQVLIQKSWAALEHAKQHLEVRLKKYVVVREPSQGIFNPHHALLGKIYFTRAKLLTFFSQYVLEDRQVLASESFAGQRRTEASTHLGRLYLAEKARLYAAADGDSEVYACYAATQSYLYLAAAYAQSEIWSSPTSEALNPSACLQWAETLRNHALLTYAETGRRCYYDIKEKSGLPDEYDEYDAYDNKDPYEIAKLPAILELRGAEKQQVSRKEDSFITLDISLLGMDPALLPKLTPERPTDNIYLFGTNACYLFFARGMYLLCSDRITEFELDKAQQPADWDEKLTTAIRLLNMAWAIAEDGCRFENVKKKVNGKTESYRRITRSFSDSDDPAQYTSQEITSVRDLYPRRITEIADLGKIFSAACMVLRLHLVSEEARSPIQTDIEKLLDMLHGEYRFRQQKTLKALLRRQTRYNGHLQDYLASASSILLAHADQASEPNSIQTHRDRLMSALFGALLDPE